MNDILDAQKRKAKDAKPGSRTDRNTAYASLKRMWHTRIALCAAQQGFKLVGPSHFLYVHYEIARKRDPSNFCSGAQKLIEDGLQAAFVLKNDGWKDILSFRHLWTVRTPKPGVMVYVRNVEFSLMDGQPVEGNIERLEMLRLDGEVGFRKEGKERDLEKA